MAKKYSELSAPKKEDMMDEEMEADMLSELDLEDMDEELPEEDMMDLTSVSDDELLAEAKARGLVPSEEDSDELDEDDLDLEDDEPEMITGKV